MAFTDRVVEHPGRVKLTNVSGDIYDITPYEGEVTAPGTLLNAANLNKETQLDSETAQAFSDAGATMDKQNDMSGALAFLIGKDAEDYVTEQGTSGNWYYRKWNSGISEEWGSLTTTGTFTSWSPLSFKDVTISGEPITNGTVIHAAVSGNVEGTTSWTGGLNQPSQVRFLTNGTPSGTKTFHAYVYIVRQL